MKTIVNFSKYNQKIQHGAYRIADLVVEYKHNEEISQKYLTLL